MHSTSFKSSWSQAVNQETNFYKKSHAQQKQTNKTNRVTHTYTPILVILLVPVPNFNAAANI